jgi:carbon monoxide dehydrogenase subunit G
MELTDTFTVAVPIEQLWELLNDVERIAPCVPGFKLTEANHPEYHGLMKVKVGAITVQYDATITFVERDEAAKRVVLAIRGKETRGSGSVDATVTSSLTDKGNETFAEMVTDAQLTGRVAQFGRGIIADVSSRMTEQFVNRLNRELLNESSGAREVIGDGAALGQPAPETPVSAVHEAEADEALDLASVAAKPLLKRLAPLAAGLFLLAVLVRLARSHSR